MGGVCARSGSCRPLAAKRPVRRDRHRRHWAILQALALLLPLQLGATSPVSGRENDAANFDAETGFRIANYRAPTPGTVPGGTVIDLVELEQLEREGKPVLLDVMAAEGAGADPATGVWQLSKPRLNKAGSVWLPNVGRGVLTPQLEVYFKDNLARLTGGDWDHAIIVYCQADCWMSWNAVKRAASYGYSALYWYPDGTDGMRDWDVPLVAAVPVPMAGQLSSHQLSSHQLPSQK